MESPSTAVPSVIKSLASSQTVQNMSGSDTMSSGN